MLLMALVATTAVSAQDVQDRQDRHGPNPEKRIEHQIKRLDKKLNLTDEQKKLLKDYYTEFDQLQKARMQQIRQQEKREREALDGKIKSILTEEQKAKFAEMKEQEKEMWKDNDGRMGPRFGRGHGPGDRPMMPPSRGMDFEN